MRLYLKTRKDRLKFRLRTRLQVRANSQTKGLEQGWKQRARPGRDVKNPFISILSLSFSPSPHTCETLTLSLHCAKPIWGKNRLSSDIRNHPPPPHYHAHYFQAPATQANANPVHRVLSYPSPGNEILSVSVAWLASSIFDIAYM